MREIKFRAWDGKKMLPQDKIFVEFPEDRYGRGTLDVAINDVLYKYTIMQYTGLKDKHENKLYEGDIVKHNAYGKDNILQIRWSKEFAGFFTTINLMGFPIFSNTERIEKIGNTYQNPELTKNIINYENYEI